MQARIHLSWQELSGKPSWPRHKLLESAILNFCNVFSWMVDSGLLVSHRNFSWFSIVLMVRPDHMTRQIHAIIRWNHNAHRLHTMLLALPFNSELD